MFTFLYTPESELTAFIKPSVTVCSHWYDRVQYSTMHYTSEYGTLSLHSAQEYYITRCNIAWYITVQEITVWIQIGKTQLASYKCLTIRGSIGDRTIMAR